MIKVILLKLSFMSDMEAFWGKTFQRWQSQKIDKFLKKESKIMSPPPLKKWEELIS